MKYFLRLLSYSVHYRQRFVLGLIFALLTAVLNGISLTALIPLFDSLGSDKNNRFHLDLTLPEKTILVQEVLLGEDSLDGLERIKRVIISFKLQVNDYTKDMEPKEVVWAVCIAVFPLYLLKLGTYLLSVYCIATAGYKAVRDIRQELFQKVQRLPLTYFYKEKTGLIMSRVINDAEIVAAVISSNLRDAVINFFYVLTHLVILIYLNSELLILACLTVPVVILPVTLFTRKISSSTARFQEKIADLNGHIQEFISGIKVIRTFRQETQDLKKFDNINQKVYRRTFKGQFYLQMAPSLVELTSSIVVLGYFALGAKFIYSGKFTQGEFMAFLLTLLFLMRPLTQLSQMVGKITQANSAGKRIFEIIDRDPEVIEHGDETVLEKITEGIKFEDIHFSYPGTNQEVLKGINLDIKLGETYAFVGTSGSGKSTMMDLIPRFFDPTSGKITIDGIDIKHYSLKSLRKKIGIVTQEIFLFHGTIAENIAYGTGAATRKEVVRAARLANAHDFITKMENGYDTMIGVRGLDLSGGQRQRLVIARALLRNAEIMILDEATSALDAESERLVSRALERLFQNRTTFIIAHRLSTVRRIKNIVVIEEGEIKEQGDHDSLLQKNGIYKKLYDSQFADAEIQI
ncbi:ABC transporter transmembrane region [Leptospira yanagawae serovar Saopaulo str. Sao Paulo = ATCC 700523]|uniref:ABC transporter ATP-binding protein n=2 Tax=Leptospira yanagawae TaxID=293069 RepID=A0ABY2M4L2_9LEPT|nr:ABC transporter ATP-binding protein [Leptospira yanagawae]EOQ89058.1 ABC transporter transmembrane region [Leptospira yanagawae serovar Saopaulo str. Sao Paulo = ATCC 700523]TGL24146.1 ABC transporter ATP-binding protein [Leptospira yanagawae]